MTLEIHFLALLLTPWFSLLDMESLGKTRLQACCVGRKNYESNVDFLIIFLTSYCLHECMHLLDDRLHIGRLIIHIRDVVLTPLLTKEDLKINMILLQLL